jgi:cytochrome b561
MIIGLMIAGFCAADMPDPAAKFVLLGVHAPMEMALLVLTLMRLGWWLVLDRKPAGDPHLRVLAARAVHGLLYFAVRGLAVAGIAMVVLSGAGDILFGVASSPLSDVWAFAPHYGQAAMTFLLAALLVLHVGAALFHQMVLRDHPMARMGIGQ